jgi:hypothetical protein
MNRRDRVRLAIALLAIALSVIGACAASQLARASCSDLDAVVAPFGVPADPTIRRHHLSVWLTESAVQEVVDAQIHSIAGAWGTAMSDLLRTGASVQLAEIRTGAILLEPADDGVWLGVRPELSFTVPSPIPGVNPRVSASLRIRFQLRLEGQPDGGVAMVVGAGTDSISDLQVQVLGMPLPLARAEQLLRDLIRTRLVELPLLSIAPISVADEAMVLVPVGLTMQEGLLEVAIGVGVDVPASAPPVPSAAHLGDGNLAVTVRQDVVPWLVNSILVPPAPRTAPRFSSDGVPAPNGEYQFAIRSVEARNDGHILVDFLALRCRWPCVWAHLRTTLRSDSQGALAVVGSEVIDTSAHRHMVASRLPSNESLSDTVRGFMQDAGTFDGFQLPQGPRLDLRLIGVRGLHDTSGSAGLLGIARVTCSDCTRTPAPRRNP